MRVQLGSRVKGKDPGRIIERDEDTLRPILKVPATLLVACVIPRNEIVCGAIADPFLPQAPVASTWSQAPDQGSQNSIFPTGKRCALNTIAPPLRAMSGQAGFDFGQDGADCPPSIRERKPKKMLNHMLAR